MLNAGAMREWRQFRLLARDSLRRLLNSVVLSRDADPWQVAIWATTLVQTPPTLYAISQMGKYAALRRATAATMERVVLGDRMFFVFYSMIAAALVAAVTWDALFPDRTAQEIVGALPVRPRTLAAARLTAAVAMGIAFCTAINLPSAVLFSLIAATHPSLGHVPMVFAGHLIGTIGGSLSVFLVLLVLRGVTATLLGAASASAVAAVLQLASVSALIEAFLYVPSVLPALVGTMLAGGAAARAWPPIWFTALYSVFPGTTRDVMWAEAAHATLALTVALPAAVVVYLAPAAWMARRAMESSSRETSRWQSAATRRASAVLARAPRVRAITMFSIASFTRSRRHVIVVVTQLGIGLAIAAVSIIAATARHRLDLHGPVPYLLSPPLVMMFFAALGLRSAFVVPTDFDASWPFRIAGGGVASAASAARRAMFALAVLPPACVASMAALAIGWPAATVAAVTCLELLAGVLLIECVLYGWHAVPFARERVLSTQSLKWRGLIMVVPLFLFAFVGARAQVAALHSPRAAAWYVFVVAALAVAVHRASVRESSRHALTFDDDDAGSFAVLNLSNAI